MPIWCRLLKHRADRADSLPRLRTGTTRAARIPRMAITTNNSMRVNAWGNGAGGPPRLSRTGTATETRPGADEPGKISRIYLYPITVIANISLIFSKSVHVQLPAFELMLYL